jgi:hypothetical protein
VGLAPGSTGGEIVSVTMENCDASTTDRCEVSKGDTARGQLTFKANKAAKSLTCQIYGIIGGVSLPFPGEQKVYTWVQTYIRRYKLQIRAQYFVHRSTYQSKTSKFQDIIHLRFDFCFIIFETAKFAKHIKIVVKVLHLVDSS